MTGRVPHRRPELATFSDMVSGRPVSAVDWSTLANAANWINGHGGQVIPWSAVGHTISSGASESVSYRFAGTPSAVVRVWSMNMLSSAEGASAAVSINGDTATTVYPQTTTNSRRGSYVFEEHLGRVVSEATGNGGSLTIANHSAFTEGPGAYRGARVFDGASGSYAAGLGTAAMANALKGDCTITAWVYLESFTGNPVVACWFGADADPTEADNVLAQIAVNTSGKLALFYEYSIGTNVSLTSTGTSLTVDTWHRIDITRDTSGNVAMYLDGSPNDSWTSQQLATGGTTAYNVRIGASPAGASLLTGRVYALTLRDVEKSAAAIAAESVLTEPDGDTIGMWCLHGSVTSTIEVTAAGGNITIESVGAYDQTRLELAANAHDYGIDTTTLRARQPIRDFAYESISGVCDAEKNMNARRIGHLAWSVPTSAAISPGSTSQTALFEIDPPAQAAIENGTSQSLVVMVYAKVTGGTGSVQVAPVQASGTATISITSTSFAWATGDVTIESEDLSAANGQRSGLERFTITAADPAAQTLSIAAIHISRGGSGKV